MRSVAGKTLADFPDLVKQIDREKQPELNPKNMAAGSGKKIWWKCPKGPDHEWESVIISRTSIKSGCACCAGKKASVTNSLALFYPTIQANCLPQKMVI